MRATTILRKLIGVITLLVNGGYFEDGALVIRVRPRWRRPRCGCCGQVAPGYDSCPEPRRWRSLPIGRLHVFVEYRLRRVWCARCSVRTEMVPWAEHGSRFTRDFEEMVAYKAQVTNRSTVCKTLGISWGAVGRIIETVVRTRLDPGRLEGLRRIGVDEFSYRKRHRYLTTVVDHDTHRVVWAGEGRSSETLQAFFEALGPQHLAQLEMATIDMAGGYIKAFQDRAPHVQRVFDRFHVQRLASDALDEVRRALWRELKGTAQGRTVKGSRFILLKKPKKLKPNERRRLSEVQQTNKPLYRAYLLKEQLTKALDYRQPKRAQEALDGWLAWASRSRLAPFVKCARTIRQYKDGILAYIQARLTNGVVEGINNRLRTIARQAFGFHSPKPLIAMLFLCCGGITLDPPLPGTRISPT